MLIMIIHYINFSLYHLLKVHMLESNCIKTGTTFDGHALLFFFLYVISYQSNDNNDQLIFIVLMMIKVLFGRHGKLIGITIYRKILIHRSFIRIIKRWLTTFIVLWSLEELPWGDTCPLFFIHRSYIRIIVCVWYLIKVMIIAINSYLSCYNY